MELLSRVPQALEKKRVLHLSGAGGTNRRVEEGERGGYEPSPVVVPGLPIPSLSPFHNTHGKHPALDPELLLQQSTELRKSG